MLGCAGSFRGKSEAAGEAYGGGVPAGEGIDVVGIALARAHDAGEMISFANTNGIVRCSAAGRGDFPPDTGHVIGFRGGAAANLAGALDGVQIVIEHAVPNEAWPLAAIDDLRGWSRFARPGGATGLAVVRSVEGDFVHGTVLGIVHHDGTIDPLGAFDTGEQEDDPLAGGKLNRGSVLPAPGGTNGLARTL